MDFKATLNLPRTDFPMKANLVKKEPEILRGWEETGIYDRIRRATRGRPPYILHDGPPYANGHIHIGTALNKILKDFVIKVKTMEGHDAVFVPGWDCHGLPIEHQVDQELGERKRELSKNEIRRRCRDFAKDFIGIQRREFERLGVFADWQHPYLTMNYGYEAAIVRELGKFIGKGSVYKGKKPVHWCPVCITALAEAEVEYDDHTSPSIYVKFPVEDADVAARFPDLQGKPVSVVIWTTTPWTLPANLAICLHPDFDYSAVAVGSNVYLIASELVPEVARKLGFGHYDILGTWKGSDLEGVTTRHPFLPRRSPLILGSHVILDQGTGCVHTAPGHGREDYDIGRKYGLEIYSPVDDEGRFTPEAGTLSGMKVWEANRTVTEMLKACGHLLLEESISHSYPHCWRCKNPVIFRATAQWFISMEVDDLREKSLEEIKRVQWIPPWGEERISGMIATRPDWCISRQRAWGVPITVFYCRSCGELMASQEIADHVAALVDRDGADVWFERPAAALLPAGTLCPGCGGREFDKETDILDVWFDSGVSHAAVLEATTGLRWPADLYLEGSDQHRGWFHSSLLAAVGTRGAAPYRAVLTHGYVVDGDGKKMSKSLGNVIVPQEVIDRYGAEILRLWVASENYREDIRISEEILTRLADAYRRVRNTCRFLLGNLYDFTPSSDRIPYGEMPEMDRYMLHRLQALVGRMRRAYGEHDYHLFYHLVHNFCVVDLSAFYLDVLKDRLYTSRANSRARRAAQTVLLEVVVALLQLMAPVLSFTAEEAWGYLPPGSVPEDSVHLSRFPEEREEHRDEALAGRWDTLLAVRGEVLRALEAGRRNKEIGHSLEARVDLYVPPPLFEALSPYREELANLFIVSAAEIHRDGAETADLYESEALAGLKVGVSRAPGGKCERCWMISESVGKDSRFAALCERCVDTLDERKP